MYVTRCFMKGEPADSARLCNILSTSHDLESNKIERYPSYASVTLKCTGRSPQTLHDSATPCQKAMTLSFTNSRVGARRGRRQYRRVCSRQAAAPCQKRSEPDYKKTIQFSNRVFQSRPPATPVKVRTKIKAHRQAGRNGVSEKQNRPPLIAREKESAHTDPSKDTTENQSP